METIFKADSETVEILRRTKEKIHQVCRPHLQRPVRVETIHGEVFEGMIVNIDNKHLYLQPSVGAAESMGPACGNDMRQAYPGPYYPAYQAYWPNPAYTAYPGHSANSSPYAMSHPASYSRPFIPYSPIGASILPLVLYELLVISLL